MAMLCMNHRYKGVRREDPNPTNYLSDPRYYGYSTADSLRFVSVNFGVKSVGD